MCQGKICPAHLFLARAVSIAMPVIHQWHPLFWMSLWFGNRQKLIISGVGNDCYSLYQTVQTVWFGVYKFMIFASPVVHAIPKCVCTCTSTVGVYLLRCPLEIHDPVCKFDLLAWLMSRHCTAMFMPANINTFMMQCHSYLLSLLSSRCTLSSVFKEW